MPKVMALGRGAFERCLDQKGGVLRNGISALIKETPQSSLRPSTMTGHSETLVVCNPEEGPHRNPTLLAP